MRFDRRMRNESKTSPTELPLLFEIDPEPMPRTLTAPRGIPLDVQTFRSLGLTGSRKAATQIKERERGHDGTTFAESFAILNAAGGECVDDFKLPREDLGLAEIIGHDLPSAEAARQLLKALHEEEKIEEAQQRRLSGQIAYIPVETRPLEGLEQVNQDLVQPLGERCPNQHTATVDQDATIIEICKQQTLPTHEGPRGYQPMLGVWAETSLVLADQFRDGNVLAPIEPLEVARWALAALASLVREDYYRGDSACHESSLVNRVRDEQREGGPQGKIRFAISAGTSEASHAAIQAVPKTEWKTSGEPCPTEFRECAEVPFVPREKSKKKGTDRLTSPTHKFVARPRVVRGKRELP